MFSGQVRDDIFDYGRGLGDGAVSVARGLYNFARQVLRTGGPEANLEGEVLDLAVNTYITKPEVRRQVNRTVFDQAANLNNYSAYNIGRVIGRSLTGVVTSPAGLVAGIGDGLTALESGSNFAAGFIFGADN